MLIKGDNTLLYQIRIEVNDELANKIKSSEFYQEVYDIEIILKEYNASLICQFDAFAKFLNECEENGETDNPLYKWTKDTIENKIKKKKYLRSFAIYVENNQLYKKNIAEKIEASIQSLNNDKILEINNFNSDPSNNPQPPKKYF